MYYDYIIEIISKGRKYFRAKNLEKGYIFRVLIDENTQNWKPGEKLCVFFSWEKQGGRSVAIFEGYSNRLINTTHAKKLLKMYRLPVSIRIDRYTKGVFIDTHTGIAYFSRRCISQDSPEEVHYLLEHEIKHLRLFPKNATRLAYAQAIAAKYDRERAQTLTNIAADMLIDHHSVNNSLLKNLTRKGLKKLMESFKERMSDLEGDFLFYYTYKEILGEELELTSSVKEDAKRIVEILNSNASDMAKFEQIVKILKNYQFGISLESKKMSCEDKVDREVLKEMVRRFKLEDLPKETPKRVLMEYAYCVAIENIIAAKEKGEAISRKRTGKVIHTTWKPRDRVSELDIEETITRYGAVIPGVTTLKAEEGKEEVTSEKTKKAGTLAIIIDTSGSMMNNYEMAATLALIMASNAVKQGHKICLIEFSDDAHILMEPTRDLKTLKKALENLPVGGSSNLTPALVAAIKLDREATIAVFTDTCVEVYIPLVKNAYVFSFGYPKPWTQHARKTFTILSWEDFSKVIREINNL